MAQTETSFETTFSYHDGNVLTYLADRYPTVEAVLYEQIQNAIDEDAHRIEVVIDVGKHTINVYDNGNGASPQKIQEAMGSVAHSIKQTGKLGRFGIGMLSPAGKCALFRFTSRPAKGSHPYCTWTFDYRKLRSERSIGNIPAYIESDLAFNKYLEGEERKGKRYVWWRTHVEMQEITQDATVSAFSFETFKSGIVGRFRSDMLRLDARVWVTVVSASGEEAKKSFTASRFAGEALDITRLEMGGHVATFRLFVSPVISSKRRGEIHVGEDGDKYRIPPKKFFMSVYGILPDDIRNAFLSGVFEGEITSNRVTLNTERNAFIRNDYLLEFCVLLERWYKEIGVVHYEKVREQEQEERHARLSSRALEGLRPLLVDSQWRHLVNGFKVESVVKISELQNGVGTIEEETLLLEHLDRRKKILGDKKGSVKRGRRGFRKNNPPGTLDENGTKKNSVRRNGVGLTFTRSDMQSSSEYCILHADCGEIEFNRRHPYWMRCETTDTVLVKYMEMAAIRALVVHVQPSDMQLMYKELLKQTLEIEIYMMTHTQVS